MPGSEILRLANMTGKGFVLNSIPFIAKGLLIESLKKNQTTFSDVVKMVDGNENLWDYIDFKDYILNPNIVSRIGNIGWMSSDWVVASITDDFPGIASLFLSDKRSRRWLDQQIDDFKKNVETSR